MSVKIRLQRHGKKGKPFYWVVAADARSKRDGKYLEKIGTYNPNTNPATVELNLDSAVQWLHNGAQPTDTARAILSYKGALLKHHLDGGVRKGALTQEQADAKLAAWLDEKSGKVDSKKEGLSKAQADAKAKALKAEKKVNEDRIAAAKQADADLIAADSAPAVEENEEVADVAAEAETPAVEEAEAPAAEEAVAEEAPAVEEATEEATEEVADVAAEVSTEEAPAAEEGEEEKEA
ncbi:MAG TPA: 30S ribosomal protein S16 [Flavobacterium sp.]|nr:30S ribosomal protein S16 [Flavobacterium sp.]